MVMTFRDGRNELTEELRRNITKVVNDRKNKPNYYILVASQVNNFDSNVIDNKLILLSKKPEPVIGTILFYIDNRCGEIKRIWVLPRDIYQPESMINKAGDYSDEIFHLGKAPNK